VAEVVVPARIGAVAADPDPDPGRAAAFGFEALGRAAAPADFGEDDAPLVFARDSSTPDPAGVGASPIESREIALAANPTPTAGARPATPTPTMRGMQWFSLAPP